MISFWLSSGCGISLKFKHTKTPAWILHLNLYYHSLPNKSIFHGLILFCSFGSPLITFVAFSLVFICCLRGWVGRLCPCGLALEFNLSVLLAVPCSLRDLSCGKGMVSVWFQQNYCPMPTTVGNMEVPLGNTRLQVARLISSLLLTNTHSVNTQLAQLNTIGILLVSSPPTPSLLESPWPLTSPIHRT